MRPLKSSRLKDYEELLEKYGGRIIDKWIKTKGPHYQNFYWQDGYGGFSVSNSGIETVKKYILNQKKHHEKVSFIDEYKNLLDAYGILYEDRYI